MQNRINQLSVWIAPIGFEENLRQELLDAGLACPDLNQVGRVFYGPGLDRPIYWAQDFWPRAMLKNFETTGDAARLLKQAGNFWSGIKDEYFHRSSLIEKKLPFFQRSGLNFPECVSPPDAIKKVGAFVLLDKNRILYSAERSNPFVDLDPGFIENKNDPPSRAYLKLWEALTRLQLKPGKGCRCLDVGASPGGWSWVLAELGCKVLAADRTELSENLMRNSLIDFRKGNAFTLKPADVGKLDWLVSDLICEPARLYDWLQPFIISENCRNFICTIKMKGQADFETTQKFAAIPGSQIVHLFHNKHELTWMLCTT